MERTANWLTVLGLLSVTPFVFAQESNPLPPNSSDILGPELIAWSEQHKPQPLPIPITGVPEQQPAVTQAPQQVFKGKIKKERERYVLKLEGDSTYQLDDQQKVRSYEDRNVKIEGTWNENGRSVHVVSIQSAT